MITRNHVNYFFEVKQEFKTTHSVCYKYVQFSKPFVPQKKYHVCYNLICALKLKTQHLKKEKIFFVPSGNTTREDQLLKRRQFTSKLSDEEDEDSEMHAVKKKKQKFMDQIVELIIHFH